MYPYIKKTPIVRFIFTAISVDCNGDGDSEGNSVSFRPWTELAKEAAKAMPTESDRRNGNQLFYYSTVKSHVISKEFTWLFQKDL